ncbi:MAG TPA: CHASE3 domain-containing protein, partial [Candidatus Binatia bacterium]
MTPPPGDDPPVPPSRARAQRRLDLAFRRTLTVTVAFPLLALATLAGISLGQLDGLLSAFQAVEHSDHVIGSANETLRAIVDMETGLRGYVITKDDRFLEPYRAGLPIVRAQFEELGALVADDRAQAASLATWRAHAEAWIAITEAEVHQAHGDDGISVAARMVDRKGRMDAVRNDFATFLSDAEAQRSSRSSRAQRTATTVLRTGLLLTLLIGAACAVLFARQLFTITRTFHETLANEQSARDAA